MSMATTPHALTRTPVQMMHRVFTASPHGYYDCCDW